MREVQEHAPELSMEARARLFSKAFPNAPRPVVHNDRIYAVWIPGSYLTDAPSFYGAFPKNLKARILSLFPDCPEVVYLFSGTVQDLNAVTYDINPDLGPTVHDDIVNLRKHPEIFKGKRLVVLDPPYEDADFAKYGVKPVNKQRVIKDLAAVVESGTWVAWLDTRRPWFGGSKWEFKGFISVLPPPTEGSVDGRF